MVECEFNLGMGGKWRLPVLIDTWWNVNPIKFVTHCAAALVLIDTWWNVNLFTVFVVSPSPGFNRYMVECEFQYISYFIKTIIVLIDTWWNVNYSFIIFTTSPKSF